MPLSSAASSVYSFGVFELDGRTGDLRRDGVKRKLQDQLFQVLLRRFFLSIRMMTSMKWMMS
jgi:hypothetical protein